LDKKNLQRFKESLSPHPGILRKDEYLNTAVLIPLINIDDEFHFLFEKRSANIRQGGEICFPGGEIDKINDTDFEETALRETVEELGISRGDINLIGELGILIGGMGAIVNVFVGEIKLNDIKKYNIDNTEVEKIFTIPVSYFQNNPPEVYYIRLETHPYYFDEKGEKIILLPAEELKLPARYANPWGFNKRKVLVYKTGDEVVWGMTANLVYEFVNKLGELL
jgi:8-oxo-dGTP pyrophosphatase MutT (NUDIX family)